MYNFTNYLSSHDRFGIPGTIEFQVNELARKLKLPIDEILVAVQEVGFDRDEIREYIRDRRDRC